MKSKVMSILIIFFDIKWIVHKEVVLASQTVNSAYYCDVLRRLRENVRRLRLDLWRQKNWLLHRHNAPFHTSFFTMEFLTKNNMTVVPTYPSRLTYFHATFRFLRSKGRHSDKIEVFETEPQAVLSTFTEDDFQEAFGRSAGIGAYARKRTISRAMVASNPKVSF
jgi:hypothetical protein